MRLKELKFHPYSFGLTTGQQRSALQIEVISSDNAVSWGEAAPLPGWSRDTLAETAAQLRENCHLLIDTDWQLSSLFEELATFKLLPAASFALESALLRLLNPQPSSHIATSALLMGSIDQITQQAEQRAAEGHTSAKLKVSNHSFKDAKFLIDSLKGLFKLRIDVNRAWSTADARTFFSQFPPGIFDYVEEPFTNPHDLKLFTHPLAIDESFPEMVSLEQLSDLPTLKAVIYKPTIQGGILHCRPLQQWCQKNDIQLVLSSSFESPLGLQQIVDMASRLSITTPLGIGTRYFLSMQADDQTGESVS
jgi:O-succinylbenzoate synthase